MEPHDIIAQARGVFDAELHTTESKAILSDAAHLEKLLALTDVQPAKCYLDLGTGSGYVALEFAARHPEIRVTGLDIATASIEANNRIRQEKGIRNVEFASYDGLLLPFPDGAYFGVVCRYALHHFPDPILAIRELRRVAEAGGFVIISDPITFDDDSDDYIDRFQRLRPDGHVHFFRRQELLTLFHQGGISNHRQSRWYEEGP
jgi:SAM-dependent methyltransferase